MTHTHQNTLKLSQQWVLKKFQNFLFRLFLLYCFQHLVTDPMWIKHVIVIPMPLLLHFTSSKTPSIIFTFLSLSSPWYFSYSVFIYTTLSTFTQHPHHFSLIITIKNHPFSFYSSIFPVLSHLGFLYLPRKKYILISLTYSI